MKDKSGNHEEQRRRRRVVKEKIGEMPGKLDHASVVAYCVGMADEWFSGEFLLFVFYIFRIFGDSAAVYTLVLACSYYRTHCGLRGVHGAQPTEIFDFCC